MTSTRLTADTAVFVVRDPGEHSNRWKPEDLVVDHYDLRGAWTHQLGCEGERQRRPVAYLTRGEALRAARRRLRAWQRRREALRHWERCT